MVGSGAKREAVTFITEHHEISERRACQLIGIHRSVLRYVNKPSNDCVIIQKMKEIIAENPRYGCPRVLIMLRRGGFEINHKRTERLYRLAKMQLKHRKKKRRVFKPENPLPPPTFPNESWSMDFVHDSLFNGTKFRVLTLVDELTRECLALEVDTSLPGERVVRVLNNVLCSRGVPREVGVDHGPEFTGKALDNWSRKNDVSLRFAHPGAKNENAFIESFNGKLRDECLNMHWFTSLKDARDVSADWMRRYNKERPHTSLNGMTPEEYRRSKGPRICA